MVWNYVSKRLRPGLGSGTRRLEHILVAEKALGKRLPKDAIVHHVDENQRNNSNSNLAIFPDRGYHKAIHSRLKVKQAG